MATSTAALINMFKAAQTKANEANEARYQELLKTYGGDRSMEDIIRQFGAVAKNRIASNMTTQQKAATGDLVASGLAVPEVVQNVKQGLRTDAENQAQSANEVMARQAAGGLAGKAAAIEAKTETGPDMGMFAQLLQMASATPTTSAAATQLANQAWTFNLGQSTGITRANWNSASQTGTLAQLLTQRGY